MNYFLVNRQERTALSLDAKVCWHRAVPSFRDDSKEEWLMPAVTHTDCWNGARIWEQCFWIASEAAGCHACEHLPGRNSASLTMGIPRHFRSRALSSSRNRSSSQSRVFTCLQCCFPALRWREIFRVSELEYFIFVISGYLLLQSLQHSSRKFIGQYGNPNNERTTLGFREDGDEGIHLSTHYLCECHD